MGGDPTIQLRLQQMALALQQAAQANSGAQAAAGAEVFGGGLKDGADPQVVYIEVRTDQLGRPQLILSGPLRLFTPQQAPTVTASQSPTVGAEGTIEPTVFLPSESHTAGQPMPHASPATGALAYGRALVFSPAQSSAHQSGAQPQTLIPTRTGDRPLDPQAGRLPTETAVQTPRHTALSGSRADAGVAYSSQGTSALPTTSVERIPTAVQQLLTHLQLLPPGTRTEDVLSRLGEVVLIWNQEVANHSDLPPDAVRAVNHLLASAVLSVALADPQAQALAPRSQPPQNPRTEVQGGTQAHHLFAATAGTRLPLSSARIAEAVVNLLSGAHLQTQSTPLQQARTQAQPLPQQAHRPPLMGAHAEGVPPAVRPDALVRPETLVRQTREEVRQARVIVSPETERIEREESRHPQVIVEPSYEREPHRDPAYASETTLDALWPDLHQDLRAGGFLDDRNGSIRVLRSADEGRSLLNLVASRTPAAFDPIDLLELIGQKIGWGERGSPVNEAFARLAGYRGLSDRTKAGALLEPLRDVIVILGMGSESLTATEISLLNRFEAHLPVVEMFLENEAWFERLENRGANARAILESEAEESRSLYVDHLAKQNGMMILFGPSETPQLVS